ncbi:alpha-N-acetylglucosaminidase TIM-barrel domain-containing protein [Fodinicola feengrottensis]
MRGELRVWAAVAVAALAASVLPAAAAAAVTTAKAAPFDSTPAEQALVRLIGQSDADQVSLQAVSKTNGQDFFNISASGTQVVISGTTPAVQLTGVGWYLKYVAHADIGLDDSQLTLPAQLPLPAQPIHHSASVANRFALNDTNEGYSNPYLSWPQWQHRIDVLALHGINEVLVYEGQEAVYQQTFQQFGYSADDLRGWIPEPGHQPWWLLQNECCVGGPMSQQLIDQRAGLAKNIANQLQALGMTPVLPGYYGTVPPNFAAKNAGARVLPQGDWAGFARPDWLDPNNAVYAQVAAAFYAAQTALFGASTMYKMDILHEGGDPDGIDIGGASKSIQQALETAHPGAIWAILGWLANPLPALLNAVDKSKLLVLDSDSDDSAPEPNRDSDWKGTPYAFGTIWNFGGHTNTAAMVKVWNQRFYSWLGRSGTVMSGIAAMPEAIDNNPAAFEFFTEMAWQDGPVDVDTWFANYATARYGAVDAHAQAAWKAIENTAYSITVDPRDATSYFEQAPGFGPLNSLGYDPAAFAAALPQLLQVAPALRNSTAYQDDLVDVARQVMANGSRTLLPQIQSAYNAKDIAGFERLSGQWMTNMRLLDQLLGSDSNYLFGSWLAGATAEAGSPAEAANLRYDIRSMVSIWATGAAGVNDYARREDNGLVGDYYASRWRLFFAGLDHVLTSGGAVPSNDWTAMAQAFANDDGGNPRYLTQPEGDSYALATQVAADNPTRGVTVTANPVSAQPGGTFPATAVFANQSGQATQTVHLSLAAPAGYTVSATTSTTTSGVAANGTFSATWNVTVPATAAAGSVPTLTAQSSWVVAGITGTASGTTRALVTGGVSGTYKTFSSNGAGFAQSGSDFAIAGGGADVWGATNEYGSVFLPDTLATGHAAQTLVTSQDNTSPWARAGLMTQTDIPGAGSGGYATIAVTPAHGCVFSWDTNGDGQLDANTEVDGFAPAVYVRLGRDGDQFTGSCGSDGKNWTTVGSATLSGTSPSEDVGLFMSAANADTGRLGVAQFSGLTIGSYAPPAAADDPVVSVGKPVATESSEGGNPPTAANDGNRGNDPYWGCVIPPTGGAWWQVDLGILTDVSTVNVRNYVDGSRYYTYQLLGSADGTHFFALGGKSGASPATDGGETFAVQAEARYVRVVGLSDSANTSFHLSEVSVRGHQPLVSVGRPVTALSSEPGNPATAANDGSRGNDPYWGSVIPASGGTWWRVDLGQLTNVSSVNVRNYVDGTRFYTYQVQSSTDGTTFSTFASKTNANPATDAGDAYSAPVQARYIRIIGLSDSANNSFHLTEVSVYGRPA